MGTTSEMPSSRVRQLSVGLEHAGQRLDNFLMRELKGVSKHLVYRIVRRGEVRVNGGRAKPARRLEAGDTIRVPPLQLEAPTSEAPVVSQGLIDRLDQWVLHEDEALLVLDKPAGLAVHGGTGLRYGLIEALRAARPNAPFLELVHRLDRDTSGILLVAKSRSMLTALHSALREGGMDKRYLALLSGRWQGGARIVDLPLAREPARKGPRSVSVDESGAAAVSRFVPIRRIDGYTLSEVQIGTGRTHQIRVHAAHIGHPVAGDERYGDPAANRHCRSMGLKRQFLHAASLSFQMPVTGRRYRFESPLPADLQDFLSHLEKS